MSRNEYFAKWCKENYEKLQATRKRFYEKNKERLKQKTRDYYQANREKILEKKKIEKTPIPIPIPIPIPAIIPKESGDPFLLIFN
jgi:hypothetical protein